MSQASTTAADAVVLISRAALGGSIRAGSLRLDPSLANGLSCPGCRGERMSRILLTLTDGTPVDVVSCQSCDYRAWRATDGTLELDGVRVGLPEQQNPGCSIDDPIWLHQPDGVALRQ